MALDKTWIFSSQEQNMPDIINHSSHQCLHVFIPIYLLIIERIIKSVIQQYCFTTYYL